MRARCACWATVAAVTLLGLAAPSALGFQTVVELPFGVTDGQMALAGQTLVYERFSPDNTRVSVHEVGPSGDQTVANDANPGGYFALATSAQRVIVASARSTFGTKIQLLAGVPGGPLSPLATCPAPPTTGYGPFTALTVDGPLVAYYDSGCAGSGTPAIVVRDIAGPPLATVSVPTGATVRDLHLSGDVLAYLQDSASAPTSGSARLMMRNWHTSATLLGTPPEGPTSLQTVRQGDVYSSMTLAADGSLLELVGNFVYVPGPVVKGDDTSYSMDTCKGRIDRIVPPSTTRQLVTGGACATYLFAAGGRLLFEGPNAATTVLETDGSHQIIELGAAARYENPLAFDGQRIFVRHTTCIDDQILSQSALGDEPPVPPSTYDCTARLTHARLTLRPHPRFTATVSCPNGCRAKIAVELSGAGANGFFATLVSGPVLLQPGASVKLVIVPRWRARKIRAARHGRRLGLLSYTTGPEAGRGTYGSASVGP
jgi:hypothetical protein